MPASLPPSRPEGPRPALRADDAGVSEVVGYILTFAILSAVLLIAMLTFGAASRQAEQRVLEVEAASLAHRIAAAVVEADLYLNAPGRSPQELVLRLELPASLGNVGYTVELCSRTASPSDCGTPCSGSANADTVVVATRGASASESLLGSRAKRSCASAGDLVLRLAAGGPPYAVQLVSA